MANPAIVMRLDALQNLTRPCQLAIYNRCVGNPFVFPRRFSGKLNQFVSK